MNGVAAGSAFVAGLLASGHCFGMCGGIVGAFSIGSPRAGAGAPFADGRKKLPGLLAYNAGRILTYTLLGALAGTLGATLAGLLPPVVAHRAARLLAAFFLLGLGLYLAGRPQFLQPIEQAGARLWRQIEPASRKLSRARGPGQALALGLVWGFLPCGLVYSMLALASLAGSPAEGALVMLCFGAGTLPALVAAGLAASRLGALARSTLLRRSAAAVYLALGVWLAFTALTGDSHLSHGGHGGHGGQGSQGSHVSQGHAGAGGGSATCPPRTSAL